MLRSVPGK